MDYIKLYVRYETPIFKQGTQTRRERNLLFGQPVTTYEPPEAGEYILSCFSALSTFRTPTDAGLEPIKPRDIKDWLDLTGTILTQYEIQAIFAIDRAYISSMNIAREQRIAEMSKKGS